MVVETEIKKLRQDMAKEFAEMRMLIMGKGTIGFWVSQKVACAQLGILPRRLRDIRVHYDANGKQHGSIRWRKGAGRQVQYHKADIEKYLNQIVVK